MRLKNWQLQQPVTAIVFDCDGTLSAIEGIDELAKHKGMEEKIAALTEAAMSKTGLNPELYQKRLALVNPNKEQVINLGYRYFEKRVPDAKTIIQIFLRLKKTVYIVSAGLSPAVLVFAKLLAIPKENIFAVDVEFDNKGNFISFDKDSPLIENSGKRTIISQLKDYHQNIIHIGDGLNDFVAHDLVTRFIGYGGIFYREMIANKCEYYIKTISLSPLLPLSLTEDEFQQLSVQEKICYNKGLAALTS